MDVPDNKLNLLYRKELPSLAAGIFGGHEAKTDEPGAIMSGFSTNGQLIDGP